VVPDVERIADELGELATALLRVVRKLPPGQVRQDALKELGRVRGRLDKLRKESPSAEVRTDGPKVSKGERSRLAEIEPSLSLRHFVKAR
jgi:hypothetical protein